MDTTSTDDEDIAAVVNLSLCSHQVQTLYPLVASYRKQVDELWKATVDDPGPRKLQFRGYRYLVNLYYDMPKRAVIDHKPMSTEFDNLVFFCRYVGPRPTAKHSLHRLNNDLGYRLGNVEWADKRTQAEVRRTTQHHLYLGRRLTDRQLAEVLFEKGCHTTTAAIKKYRQRLTKAGVSPIEVTRRIFARHKLPYESSSNPVESWDFPPEFHAKLTPVYRNFRRQAETRIEFYIRWLDDQDGQMQTLIANPNTSLSQMATLDRTAIRYQYRLSLAKKELKVLHQKRVDQVIEQLVPAWPKE
jgi:hypothetical protein